MIRVTVWNEDSKENTNSWVLNVYPEGLNGAIAGFLKEEKDFSVRTASLSDESFGLSDAILAETDVLVYWAHAKHGELPLETAYKVKEYVDKGMGIIFLHSAHMSKPFHIVTGGSGRLKWREADEKEIVWTCDPSHPIAAGIPENFVLEHEEMYGEPFGIPTPDSTVFMSWFKGGEVLRSGVTFNRGRGKVFYFQPGHETHRSFYDKNVQKIIKNAVRWAYSEQKLAAIECPNAAPLEKLD